MAIGRDRSHTLIAESLIDGLERAFELERIVGQDLKDPGETGPAQLLDRLRAHYDGVDASPEHRGARDVTNLLQEALEEEAPDKRLTQTAVALALVLASLHSPAAT